MTIQLRDPLTAAREAILQNAMQPFARELSLIEPVWFLLFFNFGQMSEICEEITKMADRHFDGRSLSFSCSGDTMIAWDQKPVAALDFEFVSKHIFAFFQIVIGAGEARINLHHISFQETAGDPAHNTDMLREALASAKTGG